MAILRAHRPSTFTMLLLSHGPRKLLLLGPSIPPPSMPSWTTTPTYSVSIISLHTVRLETNRVIPDALSHGNLFSLDMGLLKAANSTPVAWVEDKQSPYPSSYQPVMALAQNHVHFLDVPGVAAGSADIFVIHCMCSSLCCGIPTHPGVG